MNNLTNYFNHIHQCHCGGGLVASFYKNEKQQDEKACNKCKHKLLFKIFHEYFTDALNEIPPLSYEYQWQDLLKEKSCFRIKEIKNIPDHIMIKCPEDKEYNIYVPSDLAEKILLKGILALGELP